MAKTKSVKAQGRKKSSVGGKIGKKKRAPRSVGSKDATVKSADARQQQICCRIPVAWIGIAGDVGSKRAPRVKRAAILREAIRLGLVAMTGKTITPVG